MFKKILFTTIVFLSANVSYSQLPSFNFANGAGNTNYDKGYGVTSDVYGNSYVTGYYSGIVDFDPSPSTATRSATGFSDCFVAKYDQNGNYLWVVNISGNSSEQGFDIAVDTAGNVYVTGGFSVLTDFDPSPATATISAIGGQDIFVAKYNRYGQYQWAFGVGSTATEYGRSVCVDKQSNVYVTGNFSLTADFDPSPSINSLTSAGSTDSFISKYTSNGQFVWAQRLGGTSGDRSETIALDSMGYLYVAGIFYGTSDFDPSASTATLTAVGSHDGFIGKYDCINGQYQWAIPISGPNVDYPTSISIDMSSNVYVTGYFRDSSDFDPSPAKNILYASGGFDDGFIAKFNSNGQYVWAKNIADVGSLGAIGHAISATNSGNIVVVGEFSAPIDFDLSASTFILSQSGTDIFIAYYDTNCQLQWVFNPTPGGNDTPYDVYQDKSGSIFVTGLFNGTVDFDPSVSTTTISATSGFNGDIFLAKYSQAVTTGVNKFNGSRVEIFPNPNSGVFTINCEDHSQISIRNLYGELVFKNEVGIEKNKIDIREYSCGVYFIEITNDKQHFITKIVKN